MNDNNNNAGSPLTNAWEIKHEELSKEGREYLGRGSFGKVYKCLWQNKKEVAIKKMMDDTHKLLAIFQHEMSVMTRLNSPYIIQFYGVCNLNKFSCCIVMEYMPQGALNKVLEDNTIALEWSVRTQIALDIGYGLHYLHSQSPVILHRDLNSKNVLLDNHYRAKLCDFGLAEIKDSIRSQTTGTEEGKGTPAWMAPELFNMTKDLKVHHTRESDIYSYGMVLWELATRKKPFVGANIYQLGQHVKEGGRETIPQDCDEKFIELIKNCWLSDPIKRPEMQTILARLEKAEENLSAQTEMQIQFVPPLEEGEVSHKRLKTSTETASRISYTLNNNNIHINSLNNSQLFYPYRFSEMTTSSKVDNVYMDMGFSVLSTQQNENSDVDEQSLLSSGIDRSITVGVNSLPSLQMGMNLEMHLLQQLLAQQSSNEQLVSVLLETFASTDNSATVQFIFKQLQALRLPEAQLVSVLREKFSSTIDSIDTVQFIFEQLALRLPEEQLVSVLRVEFSSTTDIDITQFIFKQLQVRRLLEEQLVFILLEKFSSTNDIDIIQFIVKQLQARRLLEEQLVSVLLEKFSSTNDIDITQFIVKQLQVLQLPDAQLVSVLREKFASTDDSEIAQFIVKQLQALRLPDVQLVSVLLEKFSSPTNSDIAQFIVKQLQALRLPEEQLVSVLRENFLRTSDNDTLQFIFKQLRTQRLPEAQLISVLLEKFLRIFDIDTLQFIFKQLQTQRLPELQLVSVLLEKFSSPIDGAIVRFILEKLEEFNDMDDLIVKKLIDIKSEINNEINERRDSFSINSKRIFSSYNLLKEERAILNLIESDITKRTNKAKPTFEKSQAESANSVDVPNFKLG